MYLHPHILLNHYLFGILCFNITVQHPENVVIKQAGTIINNPIIAILQELKMTVGMF